MKKFFNCFLISILFLSVTSCISYKELQVKEVQSVKILCVNADNTTDVAVTLKIANPNRWKLIVRDYNLEAFINTKYVGKLHFDKKILIPRHSENYYTLVLKADMDQVKKLMPSLIFSSKALLSVKGDLKVKAKGVSKKIKIDREESISRKDLGNLMMSNN